MMVFKRDLLRVNTYETRLQMGEAAAAACALAVHAVLQRKNECNMIFAAAPSQKEFLAGLLKKNVDFSKINAFHMDEYVGYNRLDKQSFSAFLHESFFRYARFKSVNLLDCKGDIEQTMHDYAALLLRLPPDIVCMGIGENGHIAFNDPPADFFDTRVLKRVTLEKKCRIQQVNDGCFASLDDVPKYAVTLTVPALLSAAHIICTVPGSRKADAVRAVLYGGIDQNCPATILRTHADAQMFLDRDSASCIELREAIG